MDSTATLLWGMFFGAIGLGFFTYGRKQRAVMPLLAGIALMVFPYFVPNVFTLLSVGAVLTVLPYFVRV